MAEVFDAGPGLVVDLAADFRIHDSALHEKLLRGAPGAGTRSTGSATGWPTCWAPAPRRDGDRRTRLLRHGGAAGPSPSAAGVAAPPSSSAVTGSSGAGASPADDPSPGPGPQLLRLFVLGTGTRARC